MTGAGRGLSLNVVCLTTFILPIDRGRSAYSTSASTDPRPKVGPARLDVHQGAEIGFFPVDFRKDRANDKVVRLGIKGWGVGFAGDPSRALPSPRSLARSTEDRLLRLRLAVGVRN